MGKSTTLCFKIIACGGGDSGDLRTTENKGSSNQRGWSFRKRSARHRVLSNSIILESPSSVSKETQESTTVINLQVQPDLSVPEKIPVVHQEEDKNTESTQLDFKSSDTEAEKEDDCGPNATINESSAIIIQSAIRGLLAQRWLLKQKSAVKLQTALRGHLVRRHAIGTLHCVQAIIKMQALVRARLACLTVEGSVDCAKQGESCGKDKNNSSILGKRKAKPIDSYQYISIEKLLSNAFARQLMESTPRNVPINIKCDPSKSDSSWKWLERWTSFSSMTKGGAEESESLAESGRHSDEKDCISVPSAESSNFNSGAAVSAEAFENSKKLIDCDPIDEMVLKSPPCDEQENVSSKNIETEVKNFSRKASNPTFLAAQSKFEELSSTTTSPELSMSSNLSSMDKATCSAEQQFPSMDNGLGGKIVSHTSEIHVGGSECGTELSISSTLDSPERPEAGLNDVEQGGILLDKADRIRNRESLFEVKANGKSAITETDLSYNNSNNMVQDECIELFNSTDSVESPRMEKKLEADPGALQEAFHPVDKSSPIASPRSHISVPESQATPSSQVSAKPKKNKGEKSESSLKNRPSGSTDKKSVSRGSEQLREQKTGKRRSSFGSAELDQREQEPRESSTNNPLPSYMQATKSARAKAIASGSPRSSPDVLEKDVYVKKRHSLPGLNERQGSPRIQRSHSVAQQNAKGNDTHSPQDRKWRR